MDRLAPRRLGPTKVLCAMPGCGGGIGRVEQLLDRSWDNLEEKGHLEVTSIRKLDRSGFIERRRTTRSWSAGGSRRKLTQMVLSHWLVEKPDLVIFGHLNFSPLGLLMQALRPSNKFVTIAYGIDAWNKLPPLVSLSLRRSQAVWSISDYTRQRLLKNSGISEGKVRLLPPVLMPEHAATLARDGDRVRPGCSILTVSRLDASERAKGVDKVLQALPRLVSPFGKVTYRVVGQGTDQARLRTLARQLGIDKQVEFLGSVNDQRLAELYRGCDIFVLPSSKEGFGLVFLEAMAAGKPVVAAKAGGVPEVVVDGQTGFLVDSGDIAAIAEALTVLIQDRQLRARMGRNAREIASEKFSFDKYVRKLSNLIDDLLGQTQSTAAEAET